VADEDFTWNVLPSGQPMKPKRPDPRRPEPKEEKQATHGPRCCCIFHRKKKEIPHA